jgi:hypothetical protein
VSTPASKLPLGLLDLLGVKSLGRYPQTLLDTYQPVFEQINIIHATQSTAELDATTAIGGVNYTPSAIVVPQNEVWYFPANSVWALVVTGVGDAIVFELAMSGRGGIRILGDQRTVGASAQGSSGNRSEFFLPPGGDLGIQTQTFTGALTFLMRAQPLRMLL